MLFHVAQGENYVLLLSELQTFVSFTENNNINSGI